MLRIIIELYLLFILQAFPNSSAQTKPKLTLDEFFDYTTFSSLSFSPNDQYLLFQTKSPSWNTSSYESRLWIYDTQQRTRKLITSNPHKTIKPQWSPNGHWIALLLDETPSNTTDHHRYRRSIQDYPQTDQYIYLYSLLSNDLLPIRIGKDIPLAFTWSNTDFSLYLATTNLQSAIEDDNLNREEWKDVIQYRQNKKYEQSIIFRVDINQNNPLLTVERNIVKNVSFFIGELLFVPFEEKLLITSVSPLIEDLQDFEIYSIDLRNISSTLVRLTNNGGLENELEVSNDGKYIVFKFSPLSSNREPFNYSQTHLYSLNLIDGQITRLAQNFNGSINEYIIRSDGGVYILGQLGTEVQIYSQRSLSDDLIQHFGWNGTYESITLSNQHSIAFVYSSTEKPMEVYLINNIDQLQTAQPITNENTLFTQRDLPQAKVYKWTNEDDHQIIEGLLHYPPGKFESKNLPLLLLIHGGPYSASINRFSPDWYTWAALAASEGWLVLEPNYRGSTGYGDQFVKEIRYRPLSLPGKDILSGVDQLIRDGIVDPYRLTVGGYSYGGFLTNWLITQTKRFNAALSGASSIDHTSTWGTNDLPVFLTDLFGGYPWEVPHIYQNEAPIYQLDRVRTPTLISAGESDIRVPSSQSYIMERGLYYRGIPVKLLTFPKEGHELDINPWHGKIKIREELKWLKQYGNQL
jgi:dipeptidyl aminopeptidase/acylaminoacyl peptidase